MIKYICIVYVATRNFTWNFAYQKINVQLNNIANYEKFAVKIMLMPS